MKNDTVGFKVGIKDDTHNKYDDCITSRPTLNTRTRLLTNLILACQFFLICVSIAMPAAASPILAFISS